MEAFGRELLRIGVAHDLAQCLEESVLPQPDRELTEGLQIYCLDHVADPYPICHTLVIDLWTWSVHLHPHIRARP